MNLKQIGLYAGIGLGALVIVMAVAGGTVYLYTTLNPPVAQTAATVATATATTTAGGPVKGPALDFEITDKHVVALKPFVTNLADTDRPRYINVTFELLSKDPTTAEKVKANLPVVRDTIVSILNSKKALEVSGDAGANTLKDEILKRLNEALGNRNPLVAKVLITDLVVQY